MAGFQSGFTAYERQIALAPICLIGGIAENLPNKAMSILQLTEGDENVVYPRNDSYFAHFKVVSGGTLQEWSPAEYPFASMVMAANAVIQQPLKVSLMMICPAKAGTNDDGYRNNLVDRATKISNLKFQLDNHIASGGTFGVNTPSYYYNNCLLTSLVDMSVQSDKQVQYMWQWNFVQPLITQSQASQVYNDLYNKMAQGVPVQDPVENSGLNNVTDLPPEQPVYD